MAAASISANELLKKVNFSGDNIELEIKKRMKWRNTDWEREGEDGTRFHKLINSLRYWNKKLEHAITDRSLVITLFNVESEARLELLEVIDAISQVGEEIIIEGFSDFRNPRYIGIHFKTALMKQEVEQKLKKIGLNYVISLEWAARTTLHHVRVHWLPMGHDTKNVVVLLDNYMDIVEIIREDYYIMTEKNYKSGLLTVKGTLKLNKKLDMLPHLTIIDNFDCLITVYGREPLCLTCDKLGHLSANCPTPFCRSCKSLHEKKQKCKPEEKGNITYAQKVKNEGEGGDGFSLEVALEGNDSPTIAEQLLNCYSKEKKNCDDKEIDKKNKTSQKLGETVNQETRVTFKWEEENDNEDCFSDSEDEQFMNSEEIRHGNVNKEQSSGDSLGLISTMSNFFSELQSFQLTSSKDEMSLLNSKDYIADNTLSKKNEQMEFTDVNLKRKSTDTMAFTVTPHRSRGKRKTYGRNSDSKNRGIIKTEIFFDTLLERGQGKDS